MGRSACCVQEGLKKGPWTQEEDEKLIAFVTEHGYGNWRALPKRCGLLRCGKSCRLRWNNYLRPDIKRGQFTQSEEQQIIQLHALVGNKWSFIASQLPKRTDNEIKNYWNTVLRKRIQKVGLRSFLSVGAARTDRPGERQSQENNGNNKNSSRVSEKASCSNSVSVTHLAQWESARLEAELRLAKESQASKKAHKLFSFAYKGHSFSASNTSAATTTTSTAAALSSFSNDALTDNQYSLPQLSTPFVAKTLSPTICDPSFIPPPSIVSASSLSLPDLASMISRRSASGSCSTPSNTASSSLPSQENIGSALTFGPNGILLWQTKELSFTPSPCTSDAPSQSSLIYQMICQIDGDHGQEGDIQALTEDAGELEASRGCHEQLNLETTSSMMDLNSTMGRSMDLRSNMENWHDLILDVENNSCSDMVSTNGKGAFVQPVSAQREEFTHDSSSSPAVSSTTKPCPQGHGSWELEGLNLFHFDSLVWCEQQTNVLMKELFWDTALSTISTSIAN